MHATSCTAGLAHVRFSNTHLAYPSITYASLPSYRMPHGAGLSQTLRLLSDVLQSTDQFFHFPLLWTTQYTARSTTSLAYKYSTCTRTSCPTHIILTASPTCLQSVPYQPPSPIQCHRLLRTSPRLCPATAASGKPASPTSATFP